MTTERNVIRQLPLAAKLGAVSLLFLLLAVMMAIGSLRAMRAQTSTVAAVNVAGNQRMLTQQMTQLALLIGSGDEQQINGVSAREALAAAAAAYDQNLLTLLEGGTPAGATRSIAAVDAAAAQQLQAVMTPLWQPFAEDVETILASSDAAELRQAVNNVIASNGQLLLESDRLVELLQAEGERQLGTLSLFLGGMLLLALLAVGAALLLLRRLRAQSGELSAAVARIEAGDMRTPVPVIDDDELGGLALQINRLQENLGALVQTEEQRNVIQMSIMQLLDEVSTVAEGDLTVEAQVKADVTGAIADSFNFMIEQLREIIGQVRDATLQVSASANEIQATAEHLAQGSEVQAQQIVDTSAAIDEMTVSIQQVSENAALSATVGEEARTNATQGAAAVRDTIEGMTRIRSQVQDTTKRIRRLGESSQRIGDIVELIDDIADRTSILALNASIQASVAGEAGRSFAVVAQEVERLADRAAEATQQIGILIRNIQSEITEVVTAMEATNDDVIAGSQLANDAGRRLSEIESVSQRLNELIQQISLASKQQARGSETIAHAMNDIADVTQQTAAGTKQATVSIGNLARLADDLRSSVATFKLPVSNGQAA